jgi:SAM-dependent methyltransferase
MTHPTRLDGKPAGPVQGRQMTRDAKFDKREADLRLFLVAGRELLQVDDLHLGLWAEGVDVNIRNLGVAQEAHSELIISHIPQGAKTILDVGCGVGKLSERLLERGYEVEAVTPSHHLAGEARKLIGGDFKVYECCIEDMVVERQYDVVLFSESFQYVKMQRGFEKILALLKPGGHLLICDFLTNDVVEKSPLSGGPRWSRFREIVSELPLDELEDIDITRETSPTMDLADSVLTNLFKPAFELLLESFRARRPWLSRLAEWKFKKKIGKLRWRYFSGAWSGVNFEKFKSYRLVLFKKTAL